VPQINSFARRKLKRSVRRLTVVGVVEMKDLAMLLYFLILLPLWPIFFIYSQVRRSYWLRQNGYWAVREGRDNVRYEEKVERSVKSLIIPGEMMAVGPHVLYVPTDEEWRKAMPEWATDRRDEIVSRVRNVLGSKNYEFDFS
jgi:hypothetical protein